MIVIIVGQIVVSLICKSRKSEFSFISSVNRAISVTARKFVFMMIDDLKVTYLLEISILFRYLSSSFSIILNCL